MKIVLKTIRGEMKNILQDSKYNKANVFVDGIVDINSELWGTEYCGVDVISPFEASRRYKEGSVDAIVLPGVTATNNILDNYYDESIGLGYQEKDILYNTVENNFMNDISFKDKNSYNYLDYLEFHVCDHCNLKCKHCNNFSNYVKNEVFTDYEDFKNDLLKLKTIVGHIRVIRILGGEPLLNKDTYKFIELVRNVYPFAEIHLVTNGILLKNMSDRLINTLIVSDTIVEISAYPILFDKIDDISEFLKKKGVMFRIGWIANNFRPPIIDKYGYPLNTVDCNCVHLKNGKLARCPIAQYIDYYNMSNGTDYNNDDAVIDIYEPNLSFYELYRRLCTPFELCNYCGFWREDLQGERWSVK